MEKTTFLDQQNFNVFSDEWLQKISSSEWFDVNLLREQYVLYFLVSLGTLLYIISTYPIHFHERC